MSGNTEHSDEYASDGKSEGSQGSGMGSEQEMGRGLVQFRGDSDGEEEMDDEEDEHDRLGHLQDAMKNIPLRTLARAQKKLQTISKEPSLRRRTLAEAGQEDSNLSSNRGKTAKGRSGRDTPRRTLPNDIAQSLHRQEQPMASTSKAPASNKRDKGTKPARPDKHAPQEISAKRTVSRRRTIVDVPKVTHRDPRFDNVGGELYDDAQFHASYGFLDDARKDEIRQIRTALKVTKRKNGAVDATERAAMEQELIRLQSKQAAEEKKRREKESMAAWRKSEQEQRGQGKQAYFLKEGAKKQLLETQRMQDLSHNKRKLHKVQKRKDIKERKKSEKSAPPLRLGV